MKEKLYKLGGIFLPLIFWEILACIYPENIIPSPVESLKSLILLSHKSYFWSDLGITFYRIILGTFLALFLGTLIGLSKILKELFYPLMIIMENLPPVTWIVLAILWFSIGNTPPLVVAVASAVPLVFFNVTEGMKTIDKNLLEMFKSFNLSKKDIIFYLFLPSITPGILSAFSASLSMNWRVVVMAEAFSSYTGIGQKFWGVYIYGSTPELYAYVLLIAILGVGIEYLLVRPFKNSLTGKLRFNKKNVD